MRVCSRCGTTYGDDKRFCDGDGEALDTEWQLASSGDAPTLKMRAPGMCEACGELLADDGEGYCRSCGYRLEPPAREESTPDTARMGQSRARIGPFEVLALSGDEVRGRDTRAVDAGKTRALDAGTTEREVDLIFGSEHVVDLEASALAGLADAKVPVATVVERGQDPARGEFLVLSPPPDGLRLAPSMVDLDLAGALALLGRAADLAEAVEGLGLAFRPAALDFYATSAGAESTLWLRRLRAVRHLAPGERFDTGLVFQALADAVLPLPLARATSELVHLVSHHAPAMGDTRVTVEDARRRIEGAGRAPGGPFGTNVSAMADAERSGLAIDQGMRRDHNEDAAAYAEGVVSGRPGQREPPAHPWAALVVCDGVSASTHADEASRIGTRIACETLAHFVTSGDIAFESSQNGMAQAVRAAHAGICAFAASRSEDEPPGTTIVAALVHGPRLTVGWVGDSRAYWVTRSSAELLTHDHSWVNETVARGDMTEAEALQQPLAHALTRCLGPLESRGGPIMVTPDVRTRVLKESGHLILCSDGMWNYYPGASDIALLVHAAQRAGATAPHAMARYLLNHALAGGGQDNVTVLVYAHEESPARGS